MGHKTGAARRMGMDSTPFKAGDRVRISPDSEFAGQNDGAGKIIVGLKAIKAAAEAAHPGDPANDEVAQEDRAITSEWHVVLFDSGYVNEYHFSDLVAA